MSYIPRSSLANPETASAIPMQVKKKHTIRVFNVITSMLLIGSILGTAGVFFYKDYVRGQLTEAQNRLRDVSSEDYGRKMEEIQTYDAKLNIAHTLLNNHLSPTALFEALEDTTKSTVRFKTLEYVYDPGFEVMVTLGGNTEELASIALQKMQLLRDGLFSVFVVSDITTVADVGVTNGEDDVTSDIVVEDTGIDFKITGLFKKDLLTYNGQTRVSGAYESAVSSVTSTGAQASTTTDMGGMGTTPSSGNETIIDDTL